MIRFMPNFESKRWSMKSQQTFENIDIMKCFVADQANLFFRFIGKQDRCFCSIDVQLNHIDRDPLLGWKNYCSVVLDGRIVGFCGE